MNPDGLWPESLLPAPTQPASLGVRELTSQGLPVSQEGSWAQHPGLLTSTFPLLSIIDTSGAISKKKEKHHGFLVPLEANTQSGKADLILDLPDQL